MKANETSLTAEELADVLRVCLDAGSLLLECGARTSRIFEMLPAIARRAGCSDIDILCTFNGLLVSVYSGATFRTAVRRIPLHGVNMDHLIEVRSLVVRYLSEPMPLAELEAGIATIGKLPRHYPSATMPFFLGLACAALCRILGGDWSAAAMTGGAVVLAQFLRQQLAAAKVNLFVNTTLTAFFASLVAGWAAGKAHSQFVPLAAVSAVLMLVPGVPALNALEDIMQGHMLMGAARGLFATFVVVCLTLGLSLAITALGLTL